MDARTHQKLCDVFEKLSEKGGMDGFHFFRLGKQLSRILSLNSSARRIPVTVYDLIFAEVKPRGQRRIDFNGFMICLDHLAQRFGISIELVIEAVCSAFPVDPTNGSSGAPRRSLVGPERFFYDRNTYTGTHAYREVMNGKEEETAVGRVVDLSEIVNREKSVSSSSGVPKTPLPIHRVPGETPQSVIVNSPGLGLGFTPQAKGPERFYYDKTTYTGTHRFTTPIKASPGILDESPVGPQSRPTPGVVRKRFHDDHDISQPTTAPVSGLPSPAPQLNMFASYKPVEVSNYMFGIPVEDYFTSFLRNSAEAVNEEAQS